MPYGITIKHDRGGDRLEVRCPHHNGLMYVVPSEASWVCSPENLHAHALAGFLTELKGLQDHRVEKLLTRWGLYFRERPVVDKENDK